MGLVLIIRVGYGLRLQEDGCFVMGCSGFWIRYKNNSSLKAPNRQPDQNLSDWSKLRPPLNQTAKKSQIGLVEFGLISI